MYIIFLQFVCVLSNESDFLLKKAMGDTLICAICDSSSGKIIFSDETLKKMWINFKIAKKNLKYNDITLPHKYTGLAL